jgi:hypothetical protein
MVASNSELQVVFVSSAYRLPTREILLVRGGSGEKLLLTGTMFQFFLTPKVCLPQYLLGNVDAKTRSFVRSLWDDYFVLVIGRRKWQLQP